MQIKPYTQLTSQEQNLLFQSLFLLTPPGFTSQEQMTEALISPMFDGGQNALTAWTDDGRPVGALGAITKDVPARNEAFLVSPLISAADAAAAVPALVAAAYAQVARAPGAGPHTVVRLGIRQSREYLRPAVEAAGFRFTYRVLCLERTLGSVEPPAVDGLKFQPLDAAHVDDYVRVQNAAFVRSPNGASTTPEEVAKELAEPGRRPELKQIGWLDGRGAVTLDLSLHDGGVGEIGALAVEPALQGRGLGRAGLLHSLAVLKGLGCSRAQLTVVEANAGALHLYERSGFVLREVQSTWFEGPGL